MFRVGSACVGGVSISDSGWRAGLSLAQMVDLMRPLGGHVLVPLSDAPAAVFR